ncbi:MAG TPA: Hsp20/alpha crystallin family protein [Pyrinomonadaceae bacterium]|jgi:HSP20 family protein
MAQRWDDWRDYVTLQEHMNRLFDETARRQQQTQGARGRDDQLEHADWVPAADVYETEREFVIELDLPGIDRGALEVNLDEQRLTVRGERQPPADVVARRAPQRPFGRFISRFGPLPPNVEQKGIAAEYKDGVLRLRLPKRAEQKKGRIKINVS